jgi:hypothetical protein
MQVLYGGQGLNNNKWHSVKFRRRGRLMELRLDNEPPVLGTPRGLCGHKFGIFVINLFIMQVNWMAR